MSSSVSSDEHDTVEEQSEHELPRWRPDCEPPVSLSLGRYTLRRRIGRGGMGVVYEAWDEERSERVALKTVRAPALLRMTDLKREFRIASELAHKNLVRLYELAADGDTLFFTMEYIDGTDFLHHVREGERVDYGGIRAAMGQLVSGLSSLHQHGLLHLDIKPSNIRIDRHGRLVLLDFGLASRDGVEFDEWGRSVARWGTRGYLAPERALGQRVSVASDWFSVGAVLYEALSGRVPPRATDAHIRRLAADVDFDRLSFDAAAPADLVELCRHLLLPNPARRARTADVALALGIDTTTEGPPSLTPERFIGRRRELEQLRRAHALVCGGKAAVVHVRGPSGIGKTALVRQFVRTLDSAPLVFEGRCYELESVPYKGLDEVADTIARFLLRLEPDAVAELLPDDAPLCARIFPVLRRVPELAEVSEEAAIDPHQLRRRAFRALKSLLTRLAESRPTLVVLDDLQWGDMDTLHLLNEMVSAPPPPIMLVLVYRTDNEAGDALMTELARQRLGTEGADVSDVLLGALSDEECASLARSLSAGDGSAALAIAREAGGSPFLLELLARHAAGSDEDPPSLSSALRREIELLDESARHLLEVVAVSGRPLPQEVAFQAAAASGAARAALAQLRRRCLLRICGHTASSDIEVYHDAVRVSVRALLSEDARRTHHRALAAALEASERADHEALARHHHGAGDLAEAARHATAAAENAEELWAFERAAELYAFACECDPPTRLTLSIKRAEALAKAGHSGEAAELYLACARQMHGNPDLQRRAAEEYMVSGRIAVGIDTLRPVLDSAGLSYPAAPWRALLSIVKNLALLRIRGHSFAARAPGDIDPAVAARLLTCFAAGRGLVSCDPVRGSDYIVQGTLLALQAGDAAHVARGLSYVGLMYVYEGFDWAVSSGFGLIDEAERVAREHDDLAALGWVTTVRGLASTSIGAWRASVEQIDEAVGLLRARTVGTRWEQIVGLSTALLALAAMGQVDTLRARALELEREADEVGEVFGAVEASLYLSMADLAADAPARARRRLTEALDRWTDEGFHFQHWTALRYRTYCDLYEGASQETADRLRAGCAAARQSRLFDNQIVRGEGAWLDALVSLALLARGLGRRGELEKRVERAAAKLAREHRAWTDGSAWSVRAGLAAVRGERHRAIAHLRKARELFVGAQMELHAVVAKLRLGELLSGAAGQSLAAEARARMRSEHGIAEPERWCEIYLPGARR